MKRKLVAALLALCMSLALAACKKPETDREEVVAAVEETTEPEETEYVEEEPEPEPTEEPEIAAPEAVVPSGELSDDLYSFQIQVNDTVYQIPMTFSDFEGLGWEYDGDADSTLDPNSYTLTEVWKKGKISCYTQFINLGQDVLPYRDCLIGQFQIGDSYSNDNAEINFILPGGIQYKVSTKDDIIAAYGDPSYLYEGELHTTMEYQYESYREVEFKLNADGILSEVTIENMIPIETNDSSASSEVSDEVPEIISKYKEPKELGDDFGTFNVEYDGALYSMPAPVAEFEKNGWKILEDSSDQTVIAQGNGWITLMKNNQKLRAMVDNYSDKATTINNCFVTNVMGSDNSTKIDITIPRGIKRGMSEDKVKELLKDVDYETDSSTSFNYYEISGKGANNSYSIAVSEGKVVTIEVQNSPKYKEWFK